MKRLIVIMTFVLCGCIWTTSCNDDDGDKWMTLPVSPPDNTLAGSISINNYLTMEGSFDGIALENYQYDLSRLNIYKIFDTKVGLSISSEWGETTINVVIPVISVSGKPYDATFDFTSEDATVLYGDAGYTSVDATITGWIKCKNPPEPFVVDSRSTPVEREYTCEIIINCNVDGKILNLKITGVSPWL